MKQLYKVKIPDYKAEYTRAASEDQALYYIVTRIGNADKDKIVYWNGQTYGKNQWGVAISLMKKSPDVKITIIKEEVKKETPKKKEDEQLKLFKGDKQMNWLKRKAEKEISGSRDFKFGDDDLEIVAQVYEGVIRDGLVGYLRIREKGRSGTYHSTEIVNTDFKKYKEFNELYKKDPEAASKLENETVEAAEKYLLSVLKDIKLGSV